MQEHIRDSLPRKDDDDYGFAPPEPEFLPPVGHNEMLHYFHTTCAGQDDDLHSRRLPGHRLHEIPFDPAEDQKHVWGIQLAEAEVREWLYLSVPTLVLFIISTVFGIVWSVKKHDVQTGFTVAAYMVASGLALLGSMQVFLENV
jgi:hypothetical protein